VDQASVSRETIYRAVVLAAALLVIGLVFRQLVTLMVAVLITVLIAIPLAASADFLERYRVPRPLGALAGLLLGLGVIAAVVAAVAPTFVDETEQFVDEVPRIIDELEQEVTDLTGAEPGEVGQEVQDFLERFTEDPEHLIGPLTAIGIGIAGVLGAILLMLITAYYIAVRPQPLVNGLVSLFPPQRRDWARGVLARIRGAWIGWMQGVAIDMLITLVLVYVGLSLIGLDFALVFAVVSALFVLVPYFGAIVGGVAPVLFAFTDSPEKALLTLAVYTLVQQIEGNITIPLVMSQTVRLHPALIAVGVVVVAQLFGFVGLFVAVPIVSLIVILVDEVWVKPREAEPAAPAASPG
jgi:predicted PurR-regulated permease PerM